MNRLTRLLIACVSGLALLVSNSPGSFSQDAAPKQRTDRYGDPLPKGAIARLGTIRYRSKAFFGMQPYALFHDGKTLLITHDQSIELWDLDTGLVTKRFDLKPLNIRGAAVSPDGKQIAVAGFSVADLNAPTQAEIRLIEPGAGNTLTQFRP